MVRMISKPNILLIGASGGVAGAFLRKVTGDRNAFNKLVLVDRRDSVLHNRFVPHHDLDYQFIETTIDVRNGRDAYLRLLHTLEIQVVIDLSVNESRRMLYATDEAGASYINTGIMNGRSEKFLDVVLDVYERKREGWRAPHILCAGMNPGLVNLWVRQGIKQSGVPRRVVHFEYDTGQPSQAWSPINTWSLETLVDEIVNDPAGYMEGRNRAVELYPNPLKHRVDMREVLQPILGLAEYPRGFLLLHEENITIAQRYNVPSQFIFAIHPRTMDYLEEAFETQGEIPVEALQLGDNRKIPLKGSVTIGVLLDYEDRREYTFNTTSQDSIPGSSGSCWQVAAGLHAALFTRLKESLESRVYFTEDLFGTAFEALAEANLPVQRVAIPKEVDGQ